MSKRERTGGRKGGREKARWGGRGRHTHTHTHTYSWRGEGREAGYAKGRQAHRKTLVLHFLCCGHEPKVESFIVFVTYT